MLTTANNIMLDALQIITPILGTSVLCLLIAALLFASYRVLTIVGNRITQRMVNLSTLRTVQSVYHHAQQNRVHQGWVYNAPGPEHADARGEVWILTDTGTVTLANVGDIHQNVNEATGDRVQAFMLTGLAKPAAPTTAFEPAHRTA